MGWNRSRLKRFWIDEEVPRWIGLSLVAVYVCGLGAVGYATLRESYAASGAALRQAAEHSATLLAEFLKTLDAQDVAGHQRALRAFALPLSCEQLRILDQDGMVLASIQADEIGRPSGAYADVGAARPLRMEVHPVPGDGGEGRVLFRVPIGLAAAREASRNGRAVETHSGGARSPQRFIEGVVNVSPTVVGVASGRMWALLITLLTTGVLFLLFRSLRRHLRGVTQISENLSAHPALERAADSPQAELLRTELASLRIADSLGVVAEQWNRLIDLMELLRGQAQRSAASSELRQVLERSGNSDLNEALDAIPDGILHIVEERRLAYANSTAGRLLGVSPEDEAAEDIDTLADAAGAAEGGAALMARGAIIQIVRGARTSSGNYVPRNEVVHVEADGSSYRVRVLPLRESRRQGECVVTVADVSQQVRADRAREDFVSQVTHELRTPLTNIRAYAETLSSGVFDDPKVVTECYNVITKETRRLSRLIEDILSISQIEVGTIRLVLDSVELRTLLTDAVRDVRGLAEEKKIDLQLVLPAKLEPIRADRDKLAVVVNNLLGNALKYTPSGGEVRVGCKTANDQVMVTVKDNGIGIPPEEHERVFEKFQRGSDPRVTNEPGTGIGLTTAREIARRHGGDIELMSTAGQGSTFLLRLPRKSDSAAATPLNREAARPEAPRAAGAGAARGGGER